MSLGVIVKAPEGLVLAAESRLTITMNGPNGSILPVYFDNALKLFSFQEFNNIGVVTWGQALIGRRSAQNLLPEFEAEIQGKSGLSVSDFAKRLGDFFTARWEKSGEAFQGVPMTFAVGGFDKQDPYGKVYVLDVPNKPNPEERNSNEFGYTLGGQQELIGRIIRGYDPSILSLVAQKFSLDENAIAELQNELTPFQIPIPIDSMPLQDCVNFAIFLIRTTIDVQSLYLGIRGCGGPIDVATITQAEGLHYVQKKQIIGEAPIPYEKEE